MGGVGGVGGVEVGRLMDLGLVMIGAMGSGDVGPGESSCWGWHLPTGERFGGVGWVGAFLGVDDLGGVHMGVGDAGLGIWGASGWKGFVEFKEENRRESKKLVQKLGMPHWQQTQDKEVLAKLSKTLSVMPRQFLWVHIPHWSHWILFWFFLQGRAQTPQGNL